MPSNLRVGAHMYEDVNKDGKLTQDDLVFLGTDDPKVTFAFDLGLEWRGFDVSAIFKVRHKERFVAMQTLGKFLSKQCG